MFHDQKIGDFPVIVLEHLRKERKEKEGEEEEEGPEKGGRRRRRRKRRKRETNRTQQSSEITTGDEEQNKLAVQSIPDKWITWLFDHNTLFTYQEWNTVHFFFFDSLMPEDRQIGIFFLKRQSCSSKDTHNFGKGRNLKNLPLMRCHGFDPFWLMSQWVLPIAPGREGVKNVKMVAMTGHSKLCLFFPWVV